ncbi:nitrate reductase cytochrome c-type subunit [Alginatibacterium sediminis]|uniref:Periplasmic nitrate reductase, electron transfer subunit n=1 Tax=Alginatibacterium sediminis TaxID=2164068 RepID=A0A420EHS8_9ALTE|nr:nitrate reductase cytochrome c-type subunit [Alginatibacterium sediminis]RKF20210.1 nitrate reductase cytochrome c-type subunit [Alginatibacterium sediminis]
MKNIIKSCIFILATALVSQTYADDEMTGYSNGGVESLRGSTELYEVSDPAMMKNHQADRKPYEPQFVFQPPLIPHQVRNYEVDSKVNKCLSCHSFKNARDSGAPRISVTHFESREGLALADVSPRRYFCLQCHVPQVDADPLVENDFEKVESLQ